MTPWMRRIHKWLGLIIALQFVLWMASGLMMALLDKDTVQGHQYRVHAQDALRLWPVDAIPIEDIISISGREAHVINSAWLLDRPVYQLFDGDSFHIYDALDASAVEIDADIARSIAAASYAGPGAAQTPLLLERTLEARAYPGRSWRVDFDDPEETTVYLSAQTGDVLVHRNRTWRLFDVFWMLHIMDYTERANFNNPLVIGMGIGGLWMALSGVWLLVASFRVSEFVPRRWRRTHEISVLSPKGECLRTIPASTGDDVYVALARHEIHLPSNCGGGQSCGLCEVRVRGVPPVPTSADKAHLSESKLRMGYRLACNLVASDDLQIEAAGGAALWMQHDAVVERVDAVAPFLREIVLRPVTPIGSDYRPGSYIQIHVPPYKMGRDQLMYPERHAKDFSSISLPERWENREQIRRSYSLSLPTALSDGRLTLLARLCHGQQQKKRHLPGKGSAYLYSLQPGDQVRYSGPFGDFAITPGGREKVFIGGGAGMGPLRAMILECLEQGVSEKIHYWYGSRSIRDTPYLQQMKDLAERHLNFSWNLVLSEETEVHDGVHAGMVHSVVDAMLLRQHPNLASCDFYVCGPPAMLVATRNLLQSLGIPDERVAFDDFKI